MTRRFVRGGLVVALVLAPVAFGRALLDAPVLPVLRGDAFTSRIGDWPFVIAEEELGPPEITPSGVPVKRFMIEFSEEGALGIVRAWLQFRKPVSPAAGGFALHREGRRFDAMVSLPPALRLEEGLWLTVLDQNGLYRQVEIPLAAVSPATVDAIERRTGAPAGGPREAVR